MQQERLDEAIPWLQKAKQARRYEPRHFPFLNLGRIYLKQRKWWEALASSRPRASPPGCRDAEGPPHPARPAQLTEGPA